MMEYYTILSKKIQKFKIKHLKKLGQALDIVGKPLMVEIFQRWFFVISRIKLGEILDFESFLSLEINFKI